MTGFSGRLPAVSNTGVIFTRTSVSPLALVLTEVLAVRSAVPVRASTLVVNDTWAAGFGPVISKVGSSADPVAPTPPTRLRAGASVPVKFGSAKARKRLIDRARLLATFSPSG